MLTWFLYIVFGLSATWVGYLFYLQVASKAAEGKPSDELNALFPQLDASAQATLIYCYNEHCSPCRGMTPEVEALQQESSRVFKLDLGEHRELAQSIGIRATPSVLVIRNGLIERCLVGFKDRNKLRELLV